MSAHVIDPGELMAVLFDLDAPLVDTAHEFIVVVQALRVGDIAIATTPTETYALTGLKLKARK